MSVSYRLGLNLSGGAGSTGRGAAIAVAIAGEGVTGVNIPDAGVDGGYWLATCAGNWQFWLSDLLTSNCGYLHLL